MSSSHLIIVARDTKTGRIELPLDDMTLYGTGEEDSLLQSIRNLYSDEWVVSLYHPHSEFWIGTKKDPQRD